MLGQDEAKGREVRYHAHDQTCSSHKEQDLLRPSVLSDTLSRNHTVAGLTSRSIEN